jgi:hypothetical protein
LHLTLLQKDKKTVFHLRAKSNAEASLWHVALSKHIRQQNIQALKTQCRIPEVVEWYYQYQSELNRKFSFLTKNTEVVLHYAAGSSRQNTEAMSTFNISVSFSTSSAFLSFVEDCVHCVHCVHYSLIALLSLLFLRLLVFPGRHY